MDQETTSRRGAKRLDIRELACERLFDEVPCYVSIQDRDLCLVDMNEKVREEFGERIGDRCYEVLKRRSAPCPNCVVLQSFDDGLEHSAEEIMLNKHGQPRDMIVNTKTLKDRSGKIVAVMEVFTDITEKRQLQSCLQDSFERFNTLFDQVPCFISVQDRNFRLLETNLYFKESFGRRSGEFCYQVYKHRTEPCDPCPVAQTFADGEVHCSEEVVIDDADNEINVIVYTSPIMDNDGNVTSVMEVSTDITVVRQLQDRLANVGALVASIAHSIKNLLDGLRGGIYITNLGFRDTNQQKIDSGWEMVQRNVERLSSMILDMLYCAKERVPNKQPLDVNAIVGEVFEMYKPRADLSEVRLSLSMAEDLPLISAESKDIHSLFSNLVGNAIDACCSDEEEDKEHEVQVLVRREAAQMVVEVRDNGMGMDSETRKKLFHLFFSTKGSFGTGLGLLVAHKVAKEHGGNIAVESRPGQGSRFTVTLPLVDLAFNA